MALSDRSKQFALSEAPPGAERPKIWIEGRQRPRFNLRAYGATSLGMARRDLPPEMVEAETRLRAFGTRVAAGEVTVRLDWAGRAGRVLPTHQRVGGWIIGLAQLFAETREVLTGAEEKQGDLAYPDLIRVPVAPVARGPRLVPVASRPRRAEVEPTLHAIRSAIRTAPHDAGLEGRGEPADLSAPGPSGSARAAGSARPLTRFLSRAIWWAGCRALLCTLMAFALPGGAVRAMLFHLEGGDLSDWS